MRTEAKIFAVDQEELPITVMGEAGHRNTLG